MELSLLTSRCLFGSSMSAFLLLPFGVEYWFWSSRRPNGIIETLVSSSYYTYGFPENTPSAMSNFFSKPFVLTWWHADIFKPVSWGNRAYVIILVCWSAFSSTFWVIWMVSVKFETSQIQSFECFENWSPWKGETQMNACAERKAAACIQQSSLPWTWLAGQPQAPSLPGTPQLRVELLGPQGTDCGCCDMGRKPERGCGEGKAAAAVSASAEK